MSRQAKLIFILAVLALGILLTGTIGSAQNDFLYRLSSEIRGHVPNDVREKAKDWTQEQKDVFVNRFRHRSKETAIAYLTWFALGAHYAYLGDWTKQMLYWVTAGGLGIWALIDLFNMKDLVRERNSEIAREIAMEVAHLPGQ